MREGLVTSPKSICFQRPKLKMSEFAVRKGLLIKKAATEKTRVLLVPQIHLRK